MAISKRMQASFRLSEVFSTSFSAFGKHAVAFTILAAIAHTPFFVWEYLGRKLLVGPTERLFVALLVLPWSDPNGVQVIDVVDLVSAIIVYGAIIYIVIQHLAGRPTTIIEAVAIAARRLSPLGGAMVAVEVLIQRAGSLGVLGIPLMMGIYFVAAPVCLAENASVGTALSRCLFLTRGRRWQIFGTIWLVGTLEFVIDRLILVPVNPYAPVGPGWEGWATIVMHYVAFDGTWAVLGASSAVMAAVFYDRRRSIKDGVHIAEAFE